MPTYTASQAIDQLVYITTLDQLIDLAKSVEASVGDSKLILYGGQIGDFYASDIADSLADGISVRTIADLQVGAFLKDPQFEAKLAELAGSSYNEILFGKDANGVRINNTSLWDDASARLVAGHQEDIVIIAPNNPLDNVTAQTEIPTLLERTENIENIKINGISLTDWQADYQGAISKYMALNGGDAVLARTQALNEMHDLVKMTSGLHVSASDFAVVDDVLHIKTSSTALGDLLGLSNDLPAGATGTSFSSLYGTVSEADIGFLGQHSSLLKKAGLIGDVVGLILLADAVNAAETTSEKAELITEYGAGFIAGATGGIVAANLTTLLVAPLLVTGPVGAGIAAILVGTAAIIGSIGGGIAGESVADKLFDIGKNLGVLADDFVNGLLHMLAQDDAGLLQLAGWYATQQTFFNVDSSNTWDPLVIDLDGDGVSSDVLTARSVYFDLDADGLAEAVGWVTADDAFLVRDVNGNGKIDDGNELFGNQSINGFDALAALDSNSDGKITAADAAFSSLALWQDLNQNGVSEEGELTTLTDAGIASIDVDNYSVAVNDNRIECGDLRRCA